VAVLDVQSFDHEPDEGYSRNSPPTLISISTLVCSKKWEKKYNTVGTISKSNIKIVESGNINITKIQMHDRSRSWLQ